ncbi:MAG: ComF family protein [Tannerella sp.]|jgi:ComF family protein|nr:ComF family protein [Tannerella sp.]
MKTWIFDFLQLFYPRLCLLCEIKLTDDEQYICLQCFCELPRSYSDRRPDNPVKKLFTGYFTINEVSHFLIFEKEGRVQHLIHSFKYHGNKQLAQYLGKIAAIEMRNNNLFNPIDILIPVPLHPNKKRKRGYNQSEWIAKGIESVYHCPVRNDFVNRNIDTSSQTRKTVYERNLNVEEIFSVNDAQALEGKHILLIDDVITTGATLLACVHTLSAIPNIRISIFSLSAVQAW